MANLVHNRLAVTGEGNLWFIQQLNSYGMGYFRPVPQFVKDYSTDRAQEWRYDYWGTKWDLYEDRVVKWEANKVVLECTTANGSIKPFVKWAEKEFPRLQFSLSWLTEDDCFTVVHY